ncbi:mobilization protein [Psychrobacter piscatorii]|uniref:mobilization protein n=1 Tax=Psychrobacter piscatorii TaxID=554343 RepID=UPI001918D405|nr:mobilization protein [Psychrobacter piscatorii]
MPTIEQKIARKQDELNRLKTKQRKLDTAQKVVIGGMILSLAKNDPDRARQLLIDIDNNITRKTDLDRLESVIDDLTVTRSKGV